MLAARDGLSPSLGPRAVMIFVESPWPILLLGIVAEAVLAIALFRTGRGVLLWPMAGVGLIVLLGLGVERWVVTDKKLVAQTLEGAAAAMEANDLGRLMTFISTSPTAARTRGEARRALDMGLFVQLKISGLDVSIVRTTSPPIAKAQFIAMATGRARHGEFDGELSRPVHLEVSLRLESGRWLIYDHRFIEPGEAPGFQ